MSSVLFVAPFVFDESGEVSAQCVATQDCASLGYTEASCPNGGIKCPFGNTWSCKGEKEEEKAVFGICTGYAKNCKIGQILNSDGTCTTDKVSGKSPIGVVVYIGEEGCGQAMASTFAAREIIWSTEEVSTGVMASSDLSVIAYDTDSCGNTKKIIALGGSSVYPAAWAAANYAPSTAPETKGKWCLPAAGIMKSVSDNDAVINAGIARLNGFQITSGSGMSSANYWTSSEYNRFMAYYLSYGSGKSLASGNKDVAGFYWYVIPVILF